MHRQLTQRYLTPKARLISIIACNVFGSLFTEIEESNALKLPVVKVNMTYISPQQYLKLKWLSVRQPASKSDTAPIKTNIDKKF